MAVLGLTACTGSGGGSNASSDSASTQDRAAPEPATAPEGRAAGANRTAVRTQSVIKTGEIYLTSKDIETVRGEAARLVAAVGGTVDREQTANDRAGRAQESTMVVRVPVSSFDTTKRALQKLGRLQHADDQKKDVTTQVIDVGERVQTLQNSIDRLQRFQRQAQDVDDLLRFENDLTQRQSELQSLKAQQAYLLDQSAMSTLTLHVTRPETVVPPRDALADAGFLAGLRSGWNALVDVVVVGLTVLGALVPFLVAGALVGLPAWLVLRTVLRRRKPAPGTTV
ncbi:MAG: DUF4349 domain-containing protein [Nocardioidaceae bacterium]|nr:DUF4349 domain-containing protein [Nocardioidaceae bacterium]NUS52413.1 DUF4349 domain-containing protein [Nocardioidaceae bacterium]